MKKIFITGATGFIGCRLAEMICEREGDVEVVALVRNWSRSVRLARLPVRMVPGNILDVESLRQGMKGCDVVFHCAVDNRVDGEPHRQASVQGTQNVMAVAQEVGVKRVVHLSSTAVFGYRPTPESVTEEGGYHYSGDAYCDGKIEAEKIALAAHRTQGVPVTVLRPTIVYGPFGDYTVTTVSLLRQGRMVLVDGGRGCCNCLYVDNLVEAMLLAAEHDDAVGKIFHISDPNPVTWKTFLEAHANAGGSENLPVREMTKQEINAARLRIKKNRPSSFKVTVTLIRDPRTLHALRRIPLIKRFEIVGRGISRWLLPSHIREVLRRNLTGSASMNGHAPRASSVVPSLLSPAEVNMITAFENVTFSIEKARQVLGYHPTIDFAEGMRRTDAWIKWARL